MKIIQQTWDELDILAIAELTAAVYKIEGRGDYTLEQVERYLRNMNVRFPIEVAMLATDNGRIAGWIGLERKTENIGEIGRWHPFVGEFADRDNIAKQLIEEVMKYAPMHNMQRLEISFDETFDSNVKAFENRCSWFRSLGWRLVEDTYFMELDSLKDSSEFAIPDGFQLRPLLEIDHDELYKCHHAAFTTSEAREFYDLTSEEKRQHFEKLYDRSQNINPDASFVLTYEENVVSIVLVVSRDDEEHITIVAVHPDFRGRGLAKALLSASIKELRKQGTQNLSIGVDTVNTPAIKLYKKYGFQVTSRLSFYSWRASQR